jgi:hypothetical protein
MAVRGHELASSSTAAGGEKAIVKTGTGCPGGQSIGHGDWLYKWWNGELPSGTKQFRIRRRLA